MPEQTFELRLKNFSFPKGLGDDQANFRFVIDVRYLTGSGKLAAEHVVMPGVDT